MRADLSSFELVTPTDLADALHLLDESGGALRPLAGGTDVMVLLESGKLAHKKWMNIWGLCDLRAIAIHDHAIEIGSLATYTDVQRDPILAREFPMLAQAGSETGGVAIQNRGTLGGNIVNASPAADSPPALLAYGAQVELSSTSGSRWVKYDQFHTGYKTTLMKPNELLTRVRLGRPSSDDARLHFYRKVGPRRAQAISKVCFAAAATIRGGACVDIKVALGGVAPTIVRCRRAEDALQEFARDPAISGALAKAKLALAEDIAPIDDIRSTARYRRNVATNLLVDFALRVRRDVGSGS